MATEPTPSRITAFYDGKCPMCASLMDTVRDSQRHDTFDLRDMHAQTSLPFSREAVEKEIHVVGQDGQVYRGAPAILKIAGQYPHLRLLAAAGSLPFVRSLLPVGYNIVAANRRFLFGPASRIFWLKAAIVAVFGFGLAMSSRLWIGPRSYPSAPIAGLPPLSVYPFDLLAFAALFVLMAAILVSPRPQKYIGAFLVILGVFCLLDQTRWQPWVFQSGFMLAALALFSWDSDDTEGREHALNVARLIVATTYVFSGLQKANLNFIDYDFPWIVEPITNLLPWARTPLWWFGIAAPAIQVGFGVGLLTERFRRVSLVLAVSMHLFILAMFGPFGHDWNSIVWPWTAAMAVFDILLFTGKQRSSFRDVFWVNRYRPFHGGVLVLFGVLPFLSFFALWDSSPSSALYSGNLTEATLYVSDRGKASLPTTISAWLVHTASDTNVLNLQRWAIEDLNVIPYAETRVFKQIARSVCQQTPDPEDVVLLVREQRMFFSKPETGYRCWDL